MDGFDNLHRYFIGGRAMKVLAYYIAFFVFFILKAVSDMPVILDKNAVVLAYMFYFIMGLAVASVISLFYTGYRLILWFLRMLGKRGGDV